jgi:protein tyrosine phosphatase
MRPDPRLQNKNRFFTVRLFTHSCVSIHQPVFRMEEAEDDTLTDKSVGSNFSEVNHLWDVFGSSSDKIAHRSLKNVAKKRFSNEANDIALSMEPIHKPLSLSQRANFDLVKDVGSKFAACMSITPGSFDQIEECSNEASPVTVTASRDRPEPFCISRKESAEKPPQPSMFKVRSDMSPNRPLTTDLSPPKDLKINLEKQSDSNSVSWASDCPYIHASYIHHPFIPDEERSLIVTQLPLNCTINDFWAMVWENNCPAIVMLCTYAEVDGEENRRYYPRQGGVVKAGKYQISCLETKKGDFATVRRFKVLNSATHFSMELNHFKIKKWTDKENLQPEFYPQMIQMIRQMIADRTTLRPEDGRSVGSTIVHCKAGVGRSGVFAAVYFLAELLMKIEEEARGPGKLLDDPRTRVSVFATVRKLRECRWGLVMSAKQYFNVYEMTQYMIQTYLLPITNSHA